MVTQNIFIHEDSGIKDLYEDSGDSEMRISSSMRMVIGNWESSSSVRILVTGYGKKIFIGEDSGDWEWKKTSFMRILVSGNGKDLHPWWFWWLGTERSSSMRILVLIRLYYSLTLQTIVRASTWYESYGSIYVSITVSSVQHLTNSVSWGHTVYCLLTPKGMDHNIGDTDTGEHHVLYIVISMTVLHLCFDNYIIQYKQSVYLGW